MATIVRRLIHRLRHGATEDHMVMILGLDYAGKTTLLYLLKLNEVVTTIPSIGYNIETVEIQTGSKPLNFTGWDIGSGCGGMRYLKMILPMYITNSDAVIWLVDANDKERIQESVEMLVEILEMVDRVADGKVRSKFPILILANKTDKPGALTIDQIRIAFSKPIAGRLASIYKTSLTSQATGLADAFEWLNFAFSVAKQPTPTPPQITAPSTANTIPNPRSPTTLAQKLESWLARSENETDGLSDEDLLSRFHSYNLPDWDHYTHIRLAYVILTKYGRKEGKDMLFKGLESYIANSPDTKGKTFHLSMTYFWIQIVHFGIRNMPPNSQVSAEKAAALEESVDSSNTKAALKPFSEFLIINPHVADSNVWSEYYSKSTLMSPKAKAEMVLPDKKPLPNLVVRDAIRNFGSTAYDAKEI
ncbi:ADP-ribosylation factor [Panaeolus papilionaceus]|nr:ADP-ribosylation factor [Panaeolus papilionaceus]